MGCLEPAWGCYKVSHLFRCVVGGARTWRACTLAPSVLGSLPSLPSSGQGVQAPALGPGVSTPAHPGPPRLWPEGNSAPVPFLFHHLLKEHSVTHQPKAGEGGDW